jgi:hypothetical protein
MSNLPPIVIDGNFDHPVEIEGSPTFAKDEITYATILTRRYAVLKSSYVALPQGTFDVQNKNALLVTEATDSVEGPIMKFHRVYAEIPSYRTERRLVAFTRPGVSDIAISQLSALPISWDKYGQIAPLTRLFLATVEYTYQIGSPVAITQLTKITYKGQEVDFTGSVYRSVGNVVIAGMNGKTEPRWVFEGFTDPATCPSLWWLSESSRRWMGPIWEKERVSLTPSQY